MTITIIIGLVSVNYNYVSQKVQFMRGINSATLCRPCRFSSLDFMHNYYKTSMRKVLSKTFNILVVYEIYFNLTCLANF